MSDKAKMIEAMHRWQLAARATDAADASKTAFNNAWHTAFREESPEAAVAAEAAALKAKEAYDAASKVEQDARTAYRALQKEAP